MIGRRQFIAGGGALSAAGLAGGAVTRAIAADTRPTVRVANGVLAGKREGRVRAFTNIPFGRIPARFKAAEPAGNWTGTYDATTVAPWPVQGQTVDGHIQPRQSEDCLNLNVWAPDGPGPYPVLVFIFGGGNLGGGIGQQMYDGSAFAEQGIVFVAVSYRTGVFGFLDLGGATGERGTGNNGIKDQMLGIQWVRDNIASFGGDPQQITISGQSAGAGDVVVLSTIPAVQQMVRRAIVVSGGGGKCVTPDVADRFAALFIGKLGGVDRLRTATAAQVLDAQRATLAGPHPNGIRPIIDGSFITREPIAAYQAGATRSLQIMAGFTHDELSYVMTPEKAARIDMRNYGFSFVAKDKRAQFVDLYAQAFPDMSVGDRNLAMMTADQFKLPTILMTQAHERHGGTAYGYEVDYIPAGCVPGHCARPGHATHGVDLPLIFSQFATPLAAKFGYTGSPEERQLGHDLGHAWGAFIKGQPVALGATPWPAYKDDGAGGRATMVIDRTCRVTDDPVAAERRIWVAVGAIPA